LIMQARQTKYIPKILDSLTQTNDTFVTLKYILKQVTYNVMLA
jgi:hypothetical protein